MKTNKSGEKLVRLFKDDRVIFLIALFLAFVAWLIVIDEIDPNTKQTVYNVPVVIDTENSPISKLGLSAIVEDSLLVDVVIEGERYIVSGLTARDIKVEAEIVGIVSAGEVELRLVGYPDTGKRFTVVSINPSHITVNFDKIVTQKFPLEALVEGYSFPIGYEALDEIVQPAEITVEGPEAEVVRIHRAVARYELAQSVTTTQKLVANIAFYDAQGEAVESVHLKTEVKTAEITLPILKRKVLPLTLEFIGIDDSFEVDKLGYTVEPRIVEIAGPEDIIDGLQSINIGYLDIEDLDVFDQYNFSYTLPGGCVMMNGEESTAKIVFKSSDFTSAVFTVSNLKIVNKPDDIKADMVTQTLQNVRIFGPKSVIETLKASEIVAEVDLSARVITNYGQIKVPVNILIPGKELTWAYGSYQVQIVVSGN